jgi:hypothetical protein
MTEPVVRESTDRETDEPRPIGTFATAIIAVYLVLIVLGLLFVLVCFWPNGGTGWNQRATPCDFDLLWIVAVAGALGSSIHALRSFYWYVGHGKLVWRWLAMYILLPFGGATLGLVFYLVIRGGFFTPGTASDSNVTSPYGFAALAALVGLFSEQAMLKLKEVAETLFKPPAPGSDSAPQEPNPPNAAVDEKKATDDAAKPPAPASDKAAEETTPSQDVSKKNDEP